MHSPRQARRFGTYRTLLAAFVVILSTLGSVIAAPALATAQEDTGYIVIAKHACPLDFDAYTATPDELKENCALADAFPPVTFTVEYGDGTVESVETKGAMIMLADVPVGGTVVLTEVLPEGVGEPVVFCSATGLSAADEMEPTLMPLVNGNAIEVEPQAGTLSCFWFNVFGEAASGSDGPAAATPAADDDATPAAGTAAVSVVVHGCPSDFDPASTAAQFLEGCTGHPVALVSAGDFEDYYEANTTDGIAGGNAVTFEGIPATTLTLSHLRPSSVKTLAVYCANAAAADDPASWEQASVFSGVSADREIAEGDSLACHFFTNGGDVDGDASGNMVEVRAWTCVPGTEAGQDEWSYYFDQCETPAPETAFTLTDSAGAQPATLAGDWATWTGVASGGFTIEGTIPDGFDAPIVVCGAYEGNHVSIEWPVVTNGQLDAVFEGEAAQIMTCDWFSIPAA